jgi:hypothetical protein
MNKLPAEKGDVELEPTIINDAARKGMLMKCLRCGGAMIHDKFYGPHECFWGLKCVICGEIIDPLILKNRLALNVAHDADRPRRRRQAPQFVPPVNNPSINPPV